jgi:hypothetical protein
MVVFLSCRRGSKNSLPFLLLCLVGLWAQLNHRPTRWTAVAPAASSLAVFFVSMFVKYNAGVRHVMVVFPLIGGHRRLWL